MRSVERRPRGIGLKSRRRPSQSLSAAPLVQERCTGPRLAQAVAPWLDDPVQRRRQVEAQNAALAKLGLDGPDPSELAAQAVLEVVRERA